MPPQNIASPLSLNKCAFLMLRTSFILEPSLAFDSGGSEAVRECSPEENLKLLYAQFREAVGDDI